MGERVYVINLPQCDFCRDGTPGIYDFKTSQGPWANGCERHWRQHRAYDTLGTGKGQKLEVEEAGDGSRGVTNEFPALGKVADVMRGRKPRS